MKIRSVVAGVILALSVCAVARAEEELPQVARFEGNFEVKVAGTTFNVDETGCGHIDTRDIDVGLPRKARIEKAFLLWSGTGNPDRTINLNGNTVNAASISNVSFGGFRKTFEAYADVTDIVRRNRRRPFTVSGLVWSRAGMYCSAKAAYGGATLIVVYENKRAPHRAIYVHLGGAGGWLKNHTHHFTIKHVAVPRNCCGCQSCCGSTCGRVVIILIIWEGDNYKGERLSINHLDFGDNTLNGSTAPNLDIDEYDITDIAHRGKDTSIYADVLTYPSGFATFEAIAMQGAVTVVDTCDRAQ
ncbi:hypothetical protein [Rhodobium gokarnense]|uniref:Uncharacterized protein n=1 Tax=Rhodobium gokarnense TaxID=364296 RepID=A0ABT3H5Q7_9HYPH|nr:hypothetical protein [Rhodobium gokarnense]MCW2305718.1 hypothetical protein [Rhodobium gokarnense]